MNEPLVRYTLHETFSFQISLYLVENVADFVPSLILPKYFMTETNKSFKPSRDKVRRNKGRRLCKEMLSIFCHEQCDKMV